MSEVTVIDSLDRREAVTTFDHAFVWASAGTGKTHTLTLRALFLLLELADPQLFLASRRALRLRYASRVLQSIVLTTFTRKAAAEMQTRLFTYLDAVASTTTFEEIEEEFGAFDPLFVELLEGVLSRLPGRSMPMLSRGAEALSERFGELQVSTLHSFATSILRRHPMENRLPLRCHFAREDEDDVSDLEERVLEAWWQTEALFNPSVVEDLEATLAVAELAEVQHWLKLTFNHRWIAAAAGSCRAGGDQDRQTVLDVLRAWSEKVPRRGSKLERVFAHLDELVSKAGRREAGAASALARYLTDEKEYLFRKRPRAIEEGLEEVPLELRRHLDSFYDFYPRVVSWVLAEEFGEAWDAWQRLLESFVAWSESAPSRELGIVTFDDMIRLAVKLLEDHPAVRRQERARVKALLVDEFQDTDPIQLRLLELLLRNDEDSQEDDPLGFFVGDLKQSIYRFRGADVPSVAHFFETYEQKLSCRRPKREFRLRTSFRSLRPVTDFVNHFFSRELPLAGEADALEPARSGEREKPAWVILKEGGTRPSSDELRNRAARTAADLVCDYIDNTPDARFKDILVLARTNQDLDSILPVFQTAGIPALATGARTFYRHLEVIDLLNLLICAYHPSDSLATAAVLRSPIVHLSYADIDRLLQECTPHDLFHRESPLPEFVPDRAAARIEELRLLIRERQSALLPIWLRKLYGLIPKAPYLSRDDREGRAVARILKVLRDFQLNVENGQSAPLVWLIKQREKAMRVDHWDTQLGEDVSISDESIDAVRVMTIHKAKGLEGKCVILFNWQETLQEAFDDVAASALLQCRRNGEELRGLNLSWGGVQVMNPDYSAAFAVELEDSREEARRLAYVAATRARERLFLLTCTEKLKRGSDGVRGCIARIGESPSEVLEREPRKRTPGPEPEDCRLERSLYQDFWARQDRIFERCSSGKLLSSPTSLHVRPEDAPPSEGSSTAEQGRLVHLYLERHVAAPDFDAGAFEALADEFEPALAPGALQRARNILRRFFRRELVDHRGVPYWERVRQGELLGREVPFLVKMGGQRWNGVIDLILREASGVCAVDFKTSDEQDTLPETFSSQAELYREALERLFPGEKVRFEFWWLGKRQGPPAPPKQGLLPF